MKDTFTMPQVGDVVAIAHALELAVLPGALAVVVDPATEPELYRSLCAMIPPHLTARFVCVRWLRRDPRWRGQGDGFYAVGRFALASPERIAADRSPPLAQD
jgi:hypothetical protein